jgi:prepilin-type N-terminal cleavage/methylation domain-containing protein
MRLRTQKGFSLIEIMIAVGLFASAALVVINGVVFSSNLKVRDANLLRGAFLANNKMAEIESDINFEIGRGGFPDEKAESGTFEGEDARYSWIYEIKRIEIPMQGGNETNAMALSVMKKVLDEISRSVRELSVTVTWIEDDDKEDPEEIRLVTHIVKLK